MPKNTGKDIAMYEAVLRLLADGENLHTMTVQQIAEAAGIGKGTVYEYFSSREEILARALDYRMRQEAAALSVRLEAAQGFAEKTDTLLCFARDSVRSQASGMQALLENLRASKSPDDVYKCIGQAEVVSELRTILLRMVDAGVREGVLAPAPDEAYALMVLLGAVSSYVNLLHLFPQLGEETLRADACRMVRRALAEELS